MTTTRSSDDSNGLWDTKPFDEDDIDYTGRMHPDPEEVLQDDEDEPDFGPEEDDADVDEDDISTDPESDDDNDDEEPIDSLIKDPDLDKMSQNEIIRRSTEDMIVRIKSGLVKNDPQTIERELIYKINNVFAATQGPKRGSNKYPDLKTLTPVQIAELLINLHNVCTISTSEVNEERSYDLVAMYATNGPNEGIYVTSEEEIRQVARKYNYDLTIQGFKEIIAVIRDTAPRKFRCLDPNLIAVNNGLFDYETKTLEPFNMNKVFLCKSRVNYNPDAINPTIVNPDDGTEWDIETWMQSLSDDEGIPELLWQICGAVLRPNVSWDKAAFFYAESGSNGKGTVCTLLRNLCGPGAHASVAIADMGKDFMLEQLVGKQAIIVDENDVGLYLDKAANLKTIITQDILQINRKHKSAVSYRFQGFMVQCLNDEPKIRDRSDSLYRRQLFIPMNKKFSGKERKYIKADYLYRQDVLEYALKRVLHMDYNKLSEPSATKKVLEEYKVSNDPVREFFEEYQYSFVWDALPFNFLYDAYRAWLTHNVPSGSALSSRNFNKDIKKIVDSSIVWMHPEDDDRFRSPSLMVGSEPIIAELGLKNWMNPSYNGNDLTEICTPKLKPQYRGILRRNVYVPNEDKPEDTSTMNTEEETED